MKLQLDTDKKVIRLEDKVVLSKLIETLRRLFPNGEWKQFTLETNTTINHWHDPIYIQRYTPPQFPWYGGLMVSKTTAEYKSNDLSISLNAGNNAVGALAMKSGTYNVQT